MAKLIYTKTIKVNGCYVGDPCYASAVKNDFYSEWGKTGYADGADLGNKAIIYGTGVGDGVFGSMARNSGESWKFGFHFGVDAGVLGVVNECEASDNSLMLMEYFPNCVEATMEVKESDNNAKTPVRYIQFKLKMKDGTKHYIKIMIRQ